MNGKRILTLAWILFSLFSAITCTLRAAEDPAALDQAARSKEGAIVERETEVRKLGKLASDGNAEALALLTKLACDKTLAPLLRQVGYEEIVKLEHSQRLDAKQMAEALRNALEDGYYSVSSLGCRAVAGSSTLAVSTKVELLASFLRRECSKPADKRGAYGSRSYFTLGPDILIEDCIQALLSLGPTGATLLAEFLAKDAPKDEEPDLALSTCLILRRLKGQEVSSERLLELASKTRSPYLITQTIKELQSMRAKDAVPFIKTQLENGFALEVKYTLFYPVRDASKHALKELDPDGEYDRTVVRVNDPEEVQRYRMLHSPKE